VICADPNSNVLLVFIPVGWALHFVKSGGNHSISDTVVFIMTFISIIPLAGLLGFATEEVAMRVGHTLGGLINATLGNVVELIIAIIALIKCEIDVVQSSLIGSMLSNLLLVLGMCFIAGGFKYSEQSMKSTASQLNMSLLLIAVCSILVPVSCLTDALN
jgi:Ca2+:H+ antiporter